ncbi:metallophosphoesterase [Thiotrichales bacterium 19S3-7]|nr:metallophosphoesterase [Thiotrichales bacterium 19S3-7]MCF6802534.1 metallophosphoesterase [Thiotrichales bacterium 19S3-11]
MIFISDSHVSQNNLRSINTYDTFKLVISKINNMPDKNIIFLGDNVQDGISQNYDLLFNQINLIENKNIYMIAGNHDDKDLLKNYCSKYNIIYCFNTPKVIDNQQYYFLDSNVKNEDYGTVEQTSLDKLEKYLNEAVSNQVIVCMHHHAHPTNDLMDNYIIKNNDEVLGLFQKYSHKIKYVISGHTHKFNNYNYNGVKYYHAPSSAFLFNFLDKKNTLSVEFIKKASLLTYNQNMELILC